MKKLVSSILLAITVVLLTAVIVSANFQVVSYSDTTATGLNETSGGLGSYVVNGDFSQWADGLPNAWDFWYQEKSGWDTHLSMVDYALTDCCGTGENYAMGVFIHNTGGTGSNYAGASQRLEAVTAGNYYWSDLHITAWEDRVSSAYNSVAWYGIGTSDDPNSVTQWREMFPDTYVCWNYFGNNRGCNHLSRTETIWIDGDTDGDGVGDSYLHIMAGHKFADFQAFTVFVFDDISIVDATGESVRSGWIDEGDVKWDPNAPR